MGHADPEGPGGHHQAQRQAPQRTAVVVAAHGGDGRHLAQLVEHPRLRDVAGVDDQVDAVEQLQHLRGEGGQVVAHVRVGDHADPHRPVAARAQSPIAWNPASTKIVSPVTLADSGDARYTAVSATSSWVISRRRGVRLGDGVGHRAEAGDAARRQRAHRARPRSR